jgi:UDP-N-acetylglucosamine transferase subunit ALG13
MLSAVAPAVTGDRQWLTVEGPRSRSLREAGEVVHTVPTFDLDHFDVSNILRSVVLALRLRPRVVVTTGAGVVFTFAFLSRLLGAKVVFVETMARVSEPSKTGAVLSRLASLHIVQWPELAAKYPRARLCRPALLPDHVELDPTGTGTFVSLGTHPAPFERLLNMVDEALGAGLLPEPCIVQGQVERRSPSINYEGAMSPADFQRTLRGSRYVIGHAGAGFVSTALAHGRRPIVLPRLSSQGEHVDDHQLQLARKLAELGLIVNAEDRLDAETLSATTAPLVYDDIFKGLPAAVDLVSSYLAGPA